MTGFIHPTAIIGPNVTIEEDVYIGPYCIIGMPAEWKGKENQNMGVHISRGCRLTGLVTIDAGAEILTFLGENCYLMKHAHIGHDAQIGDNVTISCGAKIGGHATIEEDCNIGLNACVHQRQIVRAACMVGMGAVITKGLITIPNSKYAGVPARLIGPNIKQ